MLFIVLQYDLPQTEPWECYFIIFTFAHGFSHPSTSLLLPRKRGGGEGRRAPSLIKIYWSPAWINLLHQNSDHCQKASYHHGNSCLGRRERSACSYKTRRVLKEVDPCFKSQWKALKQDLTYCILFHSAAAEVFSSKILHKYTEGAENNSTILCSLPCGPHKAHHTTLQIPLLLPLSGSTKPSAQEARQLQVLERESSKGKIKIPPLYFN